MELSEKTELVSKLKELARTGELNVSSSRLEEMRREGMLLGGNVRTIYMEGEVITICLSEEISLKRVK